MSKRLVKIKPTYKNLSKLYRATGDGYKTACQHS